MYNPIEKDSAASIRAYQESKLKELLHYLQHHSPFYQNHFQKHGISSNYINRLEDLAAILPTTKDDFARHNADFLCVAPEQVIDYSTTSGTTGEPVTVALTESDLQRLAYNEEQSFLTATCRHDDIFMLLLTLDRQFMAGMAYYLGIRKLGAAAIRSGVVSPAAQWENIRRFRPNVLVAVPSFLLKMKDYAEAQGIDLNSSSVRKVICIGEPIHQPDFSLSLLARRITERWNIQLYSTYASTEMQTAFTACQVHRGLHLRPELLIVEILDDNGKPLPPGEPGEVTITTFGVQGMPLLRYRTGDICFYEDTPCACGRNTPRLSPLIGRKNQMIKFKGTTLFPPAIYDALSQVSQINDYLVEVSPGEHGGDQVLIHLSVSGNLDTLEPQITSSLNNKLRVTPALHFTSSQHLQSLRPKESRKPVHILFH